MGMMERRRMMASSGGEAPTPVPTIGGLVVYADNCYFASGNGKMDNVSSSDDFFITAIYDTGDNSKKYYEVTRWRAGVAGLVRFFNDLSANSVDYWSVMRTDVTPGVPNIYDFQSEGRYIAISVAKYCAADFYLKYYNGDYICKGSNVT